MSDNPDNNINLKNHTNNNINKNNINREEDINMPIKNSTQQIKEEPINTIKPKPEIDVIKDKTECNHIWILCSHPTIPYTGLFCENCHVEKR